MATIPSDSRVSIMMVRNATGYPSTDLGTLVLAAVDDGLTATRRDGSTFKSAFNVTETGSTAYDGTLAVDDDGYPLYFPNWSVWAASSPGRWRLPDSSRKPLYFELKKDTSNRYRFALGDFRGHDTAAMAPRVPSPYVSFQQNQPIQSRVIALAVDLGDYDWTTLEGVSEYMVTVYQDDSFTIILAQSAAMPIGGTEKPTISVTPVSVSSAYTREYPLVVQLCSSDGNPMGFIPVLGTMTVAVVGQTTLRVSAEITASNGSRGRVMGSSETAGFGNATITSTGRVSQSVQQLSGYTLSGVLITCLDEDGNMVYRDERSPDYRDFPTGPTGFKETPGTVTMTAYIPDAAWRSVRATGCSVNATLIYD